MLKSDEKLTDELIQHNNEFKSLYNEHIQLEQDLEALYSLRYYPPEVESRIKELKIVKLRGKDRMHQLIAEHTRSK